VRSDYRTKESMHYLPGPNETARMTTEELRASFLVRDLFRPGHVALRHIDLDRVVLGGAMPTGAPLLLEALESLRADYFLERRELGVLNVGGSGHVSVDGASHPLDFKDVLYVGRGARDVRFESDDASHPARFYLISYPAQVSCPAAVVRGHDVLGAEIGALATANRRRVARYIHLEGARSAQLVMGVTTLEQGSVWNTMPSHTHHRRTEVYLYFGIPDDAVVFHMMGAPTETRHLVVRDGEAILSPGWSIHSGVGTASYSFCWAMGGENQDYADMQPVGMETLQ
jgi:4-deoxy-L-threo-5-hexosulose-uronate ketol-isomerase